MEYLNWMAEHWVLTIWLALIAMSTVVGACARVRTEGRRHQAHPQLSGGAEVTEEQIKHMVDRFLMWRLPADFNPDGGINFVRYAGDATPEPVGTNLFTATQADAMVRHMLEGMPIDAVNLHVSTAVYNEVRKALVMLGVGGVILERPLPRRIEMTGVTIVEGAPK